MTPTFARGETEATASGRRSASKPAASALRIGEPETDRAVATIVRERPTPSWSLSNIKLGTAQRMPAGSGGVNRKESVDTGMRQSGVEPLKSANATGQSRKETGSQSGAAQTRRWRTDVGH